MLIIIRQILDSKLLFLIILGQAFNQVPEFFCVVLMFGEFIHEVCLLGVPNQVGDFVFRLLEHTPVRL